MTLVAISLAWLMGMAAVGLWQAPWWMAGAWLLLASPMLLAFPERRRAVVVGVAVLAALVGGWRFAQWEDQPAPPLAAVVGKDVQLFGEVVGEPDPGRSTVRYEVRVTRVSIGGVEEATSGRALITVGQYTRLLPGTWLRLEGELEEPPGLAEFDYRGYLARRGIVATMLFPKLRVAGEPGRWALSARLVEARLALEESLQRSLPEPAASLGAGIAFGRDGNLPDDLYDDFRRTGLAHIVAVSGSNVTLVTALTFLVMIPVAGRRWALLPAALAVAGYVLIAGFSPSILRAGTMAGLFLFGAYLGKQQSSLSALGFAAMVMTAWSPAITRDVGFQLSLSATAGLIVFGPWIRWALLAGMRRARIDAVVPALVADVSALSLSATVATLPIMWVNFGEVSLIGPLVNVLVEPVFVFAFWLSVATAVAGLAWEPAGWAIGIVAYYPLAFVTTVAAQAARVPFAAVSVPELGGTTALAGYLVLGAAGWPLYVRLAPVTATSSGPNERRRTPRRVAYGASFAALAVVALPVSVLPLRGPGELRMAVLDVGQGDAILLTTPSGKTVLIDGGPSGIELARELGAVLPHWQRRIDLVIVTHFQEDHIGGIPALLDRYRVKETADTGDSNKTTAATLYLERARNRKELAAGETFTWDGVRFDVLWPPAELATKELNERSMVMRVTYGEVSILLTGDIEAGAQAALMGEADIRADVLKVPHHGSKTNSAAFLRGVGASVAIIPVGEGNRFGHPADEVLDALPDTQLFRTDLHERVTVKTDGKRIRVTTGR